MTMISMINHFIFVFVFIAASNTAVLAQVGIEARPDSLFFDGTIASDSTCHLFVSTKPVVEGIAGRGIVFAIQSHDNDADGLVITSFGFHIDDASFENGGVVEYKVYALNDVGYYADTNRDPTDNSLVIFSEQSFDYRGESNQERWGLISEGQITSSTPLTKQSTTFGLESDFFQIPLEEFNRTEVPPNGGVRSFYIITEQPRFMYYENTDNQKQILVNDEAELIENSDSGYGPKVLAGEGIVSFPWPNQPLLYKSKLFVGKVFYEKECPSFAPSISAQPSAVPSITKSLSPSSAPTFTLSPSNDPSSLPSTVPSDMPSLSPVETVIPVTGGAWISFPIPCEVGQTFPNEERAIEASLQKITEAADPNMSNVIAKVENTVCYTGTRRLFINLVHQEADFNKRRLPSSSSALDFSVVITGEYRPPVRPGEEPTEVPDIGNLAEASINRDPVGFIKDLTERAGTASPLADVKPEDIQVMSVPVVEGESPTSFTRAPTKTPTASPTAFKEDTTGTILLICIVITGGLIVLLGAFLLFRHGERRAVRKRREKMARMEEQKQEARLEKRQQRELEERQQREWEEASKHQHAAQSAPPQYGKPMGYGQPPPQPPPNYYSGPPQQHYNYGYGGPSPPFPPPYGQPFGGPDSQGYPYPPPVQSANYDNQPPNLQSNARRK